MKFLAAATKNRSGLEFRLFLKQNAASWPGLFLLNAAKQHNGETQVLINYWLIFSFSYLITICYYIFLWTNWNACEDRYKTYA
jgi:hypothetical protein